MERFKVKDWFGEQSEWGGIKKKTNKLKNSWRYFLSSSVLRIPEHLWRQDTGDGHICFAVIVTKF